jgi:hypothetical protein
MLVVYDSLVGRYAGNCVLLLKYVHISTFRVGVLRHIVEGKHTHLLLTMQIVMDLCK